jgi:hypothetical protein
MTTLARLSLLLWGSLIVCPLIVAQTAKPQAGAKPKPSAAEKDASRESRQRSAESESQNRMLAVEQAMALDALRDLAAAAKEIEDEVTAIRVQAQIGEALWDKDEAQARTVLEKAFKQVSELKGSRSESEYPQALAGLSQRFQLRSEILRIISSRDAKWGEELIKSVGNDDVNHRQGDENVVQSQPASQQNVAALYVRMATFFIDRDLPRSIALTRTSLHYGLTKDLLGVLFAIRLRDRASADDLLLQALMVVRREGTPSTRFINYLGPYVFAGFGEGAPSLGSEASRAPAASNRTVAIKFLELSYEVITNQTRETLAALTFEEAVLNYMTVRAMIPYFDSYMPEQAPAVRLALAQIDSRLPKDDVDAVDLFTDSADIGDITRRAEKVKNIDLRDSMYAKAALMASGGNDPERALTIAANIDDSDMKDGIKTIICFTAATQAVRKSDPESAYQHARAIPGAPYQVFAFAQVAELLANKQENQRAIEILLEAKRLIESKLKGTDEVRGWLAVTKPMSRVDEVVGRDFLQWAVKAMNSIKFNLSSLNAAPPPGGVKFFDLVNVSLGYNKINIQDCFTLLADRDYLGAWMLARSINDKEASIVAQLAVIRRALNKRPSAPAPRSIAETEKKESRSPETTKVEGIARDFVGLLAGKDFESAVAKMDDNMKQALPAAKLREYWQGLIEQYGAFEKQVGVQTTKRQYEIATVECEFGSGRVFVRIAFNDQKKINGLFLSSESN